MAVVTVKSTQITNRDAAPRVASNSYLVGAPVKHKRDLATITTGDSVGSKYIFFQISSSAVPVSLRKSHPDIGTTTAADIGLYRNTADAGAVVDADFFTAATVLNAGAVSKAELALGNIITPANFGKRVWELLGLARDPFIDYDVVATLTGAADGTAQLALELDFVQ